VLEHGRVKFHGEIENVIEEYLNDSINNASRKWKVDKAPGSDFIRLLEVKVLNKDKCVQINHSVIDEIDIEFTYEVLKENQLFTHGFNLFNNHNTHILSSHDKDSITLHSFLPLGVHSKIITIPGNFLSEGGYSCSFAIMIYNPFQIVFHEMDIVGFNVIDELGNNTVRGNYSGKFPGLVRPLLNWR
jgi:lipopolysaccharide transport system ATP-binding protein